MEARLRRISVWLYSVVATALVLVQPTTSPASPVTVFDSYLQPNCASGCDVIGINADFDIDKIVFTTLTSSTVTAQIYTNYHSGSADLAPWSEFGITLSVGDLIFQGGSDKYVVPLHDHGAFHAGQLYSVTELLTAQTVLGNPPGVIYRNGEFVWGGGTSTAIGAAGTVSVACANGESIVSGRCPSGGELIVTTTFHPNSSFSGELAASDLSVSFAAATCANDVIAGGLDPVPAPASLLLMASGFAGAAIRLKFGRVRRCRRSLRPHGDGELSSWR